MDAFKLMKVASSKFMMSGLALLRGVVRIVFFLISPKILSIGLKIHAPTCQVLVASLFILLPPNVLLHVVLLNLMLAT